MKIHRPDILPEGLFVRTEDLPEAGGGFYGINVGHIDDNPLISGIDTIKFDQNHF